MMTHRELASAWRRMHGPESRPPKGYRIFLTRGALRDVRRSWLVEVFFGAKLVATDEAGGSRDYEAMQAAVVAIRNHQQRVAA